MTEEKANKIYDLLVSVGGAYEGERDSFVYHHTVNAKDTDEWRFSGFLGFGGKYRSKRNTVDCYREDEDSGRLEIMSVLNKKLNDL